MPEQTPHVLSVQKDLRGLRTPDEWTPDDGLSYVFECPGIEAGRCAMWVECVACPNKAELDEGEDYEQHGVEHRQIDGAWCVPTTACYLESSDHGYEEAREMGLEIGEYEIRHTWEGDYTVLELAEKETTDD